MRKNAVWSCDPEPPGISRWAEKWESWKLTAISRPEPVCVVWSWHPPPVLRNAALCAPRFAFSVKINTIKSLRTVWTVWIQNFSQLEKKKTFRNESKPWKDLPALLFLFCTVWLSDFSLLLLLQTSLMSLGVFFLILKYAFQETELGFCLRAAQTVSAATPAVLCAQVSKLRVRGPSGGRYVRVHSRMGNNLNVILPTDTSHKHPTLSVQI